MRDLENPGSLFMWQTHGAETDSKGKRQRPSMAMRRCYWNMLLPFSIAWPLINTDYASVRLRGVPERRQHKVEHDTDSIALTIPLSIERLADRSITISPYSAITSTTATDASSSGAEANNRAMAPGVGGIFVPLKMIANRENRMPDGWNEKYEQSSKRCRLD